MTTYRGPNVFSTGKLPVAKEPKMVAKPPVKVTTFKAGSGPVFNNRFPKSRYRGGGQGSPQLITEEIPVDSYVGPLDIDATAVVAYGQRAMSAAKRGTAIYTIREASGDTTQSFSSDATTGEAPSADILTFLNGANGYVTTWVDQSSNSNDLEQGTANVQPEWKDAQQGGKPALTGDGGLAKSIVSADALSLPDGVYTIIAITLAPMHFLGQVSGATYFEVFTGSGPSLDLAVDPDEAFRSFDGGSDGEYVIWDGVCGIGVTGMKANGVPLVVHGGSDTGTSIGAFSHALTISGLSGDGDHGIVELLIYPTQLSGADRTAIVENMATYYGITLP